MHVCKKGREDERKERGEGGGGATWEIGTCTCVIALIAS